MKRRVLPVIANAEPYDARRPKTRADCELPRGARPCPWVACKYHLRGIEVTFAGRVAFGKTVLAPDATEKQIDRAVDRAVEELRRSSPSCALDVADQNPDGATLAQVGQAISITRERVRQVEAKALRRLPGSVKAAMLGIEKRELHEPRGAAAPRYRPR